MLHLLDIEQMFFLDGIVMFTVTGPLKQQRASTLCVLHKWISYHTLKSREFFLGNVCSNILTI